jgi:hypothetical protein
VVEARLVPGEMLKYSCLVFVVALASFLVLRIGTGRTLLTGGSEALLFRDRDFWNRGGANAAGGISYAPLTPAELGHVKNVLVRSRRSLVVDSIAVGDTLADVRAGLLAQLAQLPPSLAHDLVDRALQEGTTMATVTRDEVFDGGVDGGRESYVYSAIVGSIYTRPLVVPAPLTGGAGTAGAAGVGYGTASTGSPGLALALAGSVPVYRAWVRFASTTLERAEEQLSTRKTRVSRVEGTHFCNCWITWIGCDSCPVYHTTEDEEPVMGLRPLTLEMQEALLRLLEVTNAENMQKLISAAAETKGPHDPSATFPQLAVHP